LLVEVVHTELVKMGVTTQPSTRGKHERHLYYNQLRGDR